MVSLITIPLFGYIFWRSLCGNIDEHKNKNEYVSAQKTNQADQKSESKAEKTGVMNYANNL